MRNQIALEQEECCMRLYEIIWLDFNETNIFEIKIH